MCLAIFGFGNYNGYNVDTHFLNEFRGRFALLESQFRILHYKISHVRNILKIFNQIFDLLH